MFTKSAHFPVHGAREQMRRHSHLRPSDLAELRYFVVSLALQGKGRKDCTAWRAISCAISASENKSKEWKLIGKNVDALQQP